MVGLKENNMSNDEILAVVNKFITKNPEPHKFPIFTCYSAWFLNTLLVFKS
jgi:hypothetical protein